MGYDGQMKGKDGRGLGGEATSQRQMDFIAPLLLRFPKRERDSRFTYSMPKTSGVGSDGRRRRRSVESEGGGDGSERGEREREFFVV